MIRSSHRLSKGRHILALSSVLLIGLVVACSEDVTPRPTETLNPPTAAVSPSPSPVPTSTPTATPLPPKELTVCQGEEPNTLFIYGGPSRAARNVLDAVYDGPIDTRGYTFEAVILDRIPAPADGSVQLRTVQVGQGDAVLNVDGEVVELLPGVTVPDAQGEPVAFEGGVISMTQMVVTFTLRADVVWADGEPLTSEDSRFSYELAGQLDDAALQRRVGRTASYAVKDAHTIAWTGVPGYHSTYYVLNFYHPLPRHALEDTSVEELLDNHGAQYLPLGWGPFVIDAWAEGDQLTLARNPHYFRAPEGLPHLDRVTIRFIDDPQRAIEELLAGGCDVLSEDLLPQAALDPLAEAVEAGQVNLATGPSSEWEHLDFGIRPVPWLESVSFFADSQVRQAVAHCVDRERVAGEAFVYADAMVAHSYVPTIHALYAGDDVQRWPYDPVRGRLMLEDAGWRDADGDGILEAQDVPDVAPGTVLSVTLLTTQADAARQRTASILGENLADCGVAVTINYLPPGVFYADGPDGPVFGRQFDLALFSWLNGLAPPCELYMSTEVPSQENWWARSNNTGYASEEYDAACRSASRALYGTEPYVRYHQEAQRIFSQDLPVLPLYFVPRAVAVRQGVVGVVLDPSQQTVLWNIESFDLER